MSNPEIQFFRNLERLVDLRARHPYVVVTDPNMRVSVEKCRMLGYQLFEILEFPAVTTKCVGTQLPDLGKLIIVVAIIGSDQIPPAGRVARKPKANGVLVPGTGEKAPTSPFIG